MPVDGQCIEWQGYILANGYGQIHLRKGKGGKVQAHRYVYEKAIGAIPEGLELDHLCRNRKCVNPNHLEPVTRRENLLRGETIPARNAAKTHCPKGHDYSIRVQSGKSHRWCPTCQNERARKPRVIFDCVECGILLQGKNPARRFCSDKCRFRNGRKSK